MTSTDLLGRSASSTVSPPIANFSSIQRDRVADLVRVVALGVVIVWHSTLSLFHRSHSGTLTMPNPIGAYRGFWLLTWLLQVMPLFFVVSGAVNADAWDRHRRRGGTPSSFARHRVARFVAPLGVLVALCCVVEVIARIAGGGPFLVHHLVILVPLWTLVLLVAYAPLTPLLQRGWDAYGFSLTAGLVGVVMVSDLVRFRGGVAVAGAVSTLGVWLIAYQLGWVYRAAVHGGVEACRSTGRVLAMIGLFGLVISTNIGLYPRSMVATTTDAMSNLLPTTVPIVALALFQCGLLMMARPFLARWLARERVWCRVEAAGALALPAYLLHMFVVVAMVLVAEAAGTRFSATPSATWWLTRPLWLAAVVALLLPLLRVTRRLFA